MDEEELIKRLKNKDMDAFDLLYDKYSTLIYRTACLIVGNTTDSEDIVQETFLQAYLHCNELRNNSSFKYWLLQILHRTAWKLEKKRKREQPDEQIYDRLSTTTMESPVTEILKSEQSHLLWETVQHLEYKQRTVVILYYYNELPTKQIARILGCMEGTVKSRLFSARNNIKKEMGNYYKEGIYHEAY